jgi:hypothetical protein
MKHCPFRRADARRGSVLLTALLTAALIAVSIGGYVTLNTQSLKLATRSFYLAEAINMAEGGLEEAIWSFNQAQAGDTSAWTGWNTSDGITAKRTLTDFALGGNATGVVKVYVDRYNPPASYQPKVISEATVTLPNGGQIITKMVEVRMKRRSYFASGLVAKNGIKFSGNTASVDSWISDPDKDDATAVVPYSAGVRRDKGSVAASSITATISVGNADIFGTASVGSSSSTAVSVGSNGKVGPFGTGNGVKNPASVATDFMTNLENVSAPTGGTILGSIGTSIGTTGTTTTWQVSHIDDNLTVYGNVTLILTAGVGTDAINLTGTEGITIAAGATLKIYTAGDIKIAGNGILNNNDSPETLQIWGTSTSATAQDIRIAGNGALKAVVYAPNGDVEINGNGDVMGAVVGKEIELTGNAAFHYDESLAGMGDDTPFGVYKWREILSPAERTTNATVLAF